MICPKCKILMSEILSEDKIKFICDNCGYEQ